MDSYQTEKTALGKCPVCSTGDVYEGKKNFYCGNYKEKEPCQFVIWKEICGAFISSEDARNLLTGKPTGLKKCRNKAGKDFTTVFKLVNGKTKMLFDQKNKPLFGTTC